MLIARNDEEKRNKIWRVSTIASTIVIVAIAAFFIIRMFTDNPLMGTWESNGDGVILTFGKKGIASIQGPGIFDQADMVAPLHYFVDTTNKTISIKVVTEEIEKAAEDSDGTYTEEEIRELVEPYIMTFDYNLEDKLTLSEREYGKYLVFSRK